MTIQRDQSSQTIRIDIPPDLLQRSEDGHSKRLAAKHILATPPTRDSRTDSGLMTLDSDFQELFQRVYDGAMITDYEGKIVDANARLVEFLRCERSELQGLRITDVISGADDSLLAMLRENLEKTRFTLIELCYCARKNGDLFPAEIAVNRLCLAKKDYLCFFVRDITIRIRHEEALRTTYRAIQNAGNGIAIASLDAALEDLNPAVLSLFGYEKKPELLGHNVRELQVEATPVDTIITMVREGKSWSGQALGRRRDNSKFHLQISAAGNRDVDEELIGMVFSFVDISDAKRAEEVQREAERQRVMVESLGTVCHHMGQPATVLLASLDVMQKIVPPDEKPAMKELITSSMAAAESLRDMLRELNSLTEYKTRPYLETQNKTAESDDAMILDF